LHVIASHRGKTFVPRWTSIWSGTHTRPTKSLFGKVLNHDETVESEELGKGINDISSNFFARVFVIVSVYFLLIVNGYARTFFFVGPRSIGEPYSSVRPSFFHWQKGHNLLSIVCPYRLFIWNKYSKAAATILPADEKIHLDDDGSTIRGSMATVPVMEPSIVPKIKLNENFPDPVEQVDALISVSAGP
jgi:hypothetical protein